jgi:hypothetical protein
MQVEGLRVKAAELADQIALQAEGFASYLERSDWHGDSELKDAIAGTEREIARMEHQMATKLRALDVSTSEANPCRSFRVQTTIEKCSPRTMVATRSYHRFGH